jgi:hypothetical protein
MAGIVSGVITLKRDGTCVQQRQRLEVTNTSTTLLYILAAGSPRYQPTISSSPPVPSPTVPAAPPRSSCGRMPTWCALQEPSQLFSLSPLLASVPSEPLPISLFVPAPFSAVKLRTLFGSVVPTCGILPYRSKTRSRKSLGLTSLRATALLAAPHEAAEAHWLDSPLLSLGV